LSGNAVSLLTAFVLFTTITCAQYYAAILANSTALKADCLSMAVDALAFLGNLFAECLPSSSQLGKRRIELTVRAGPTNAGSIKTHSFLIYLTSFFVVIFS
jgi:Co/Zn/Cd efflux system component